jgi:hypothetical protein
MSLPAPTVTAKGILSISSAPDAVEQAERRKNIIGSSPSRLVWITVLKYA